jgi:diaminopimelate decarboxylase
MWTRTSTRRCALHCHLGSQITRPEAFETAATRLVGLMADIYAEHGVTLAELNLGGGHGVPYADDDQDFDLPGFAPRVRPADPGRGRRCLRRAAAAGAAAHLRAGPRDRQPGHGDALPRGQHQAPGRRAHRRRRRRRDERQPAPGPVWRQVHGARTGAYNYSMASSYDMVGRSPVVAVRDGTARLLVRRETASDMRQRDVGM